MLPKAANSLPSDPLPARGRDREQRGKPGAGSNDVLQEANRARFNPETKKKCHSQRNQPADDGQGWPSALRRISEPVPDPVQAWLSFRLFDGAALEGREKQ